LTFNAFYGNVAQRGVVMDRISRITNMLIKEREQIVKLQEQYINEMVHLPKGWIKSVTTPYGIIYRLVCKEEITGNTVNKHLGKDMALVDNYQKLIDRRRELEKAVKALSKEYQIIDEVLKKHFAKKSVIDKLEQNAKSGVNSNLMTPPQEKPPQNFPFH